MSEEMADSTEAYDYARDRDIPKVNIDLAKAVFRLSVLTRDPVIFVGETGIGKTDLVEQEAKQNHFDDIVQYNLAHSDPSTISGIAYPSEDGKSLKYLNDDRIPVQGASNEDQKTVVTLEEFNRTDRQTLNAVMPLLLEREIGHHGLGPNVIITGTMNPPDKGYAVNKEFVEDPAMRRRVCQIFVKFNKRKALDFAKTGDWRLEGLPEAEFDQDFWDKMKYGKFHDNVLKFLQTNPEMMVDAEMRQAGKMFATMASWKQVSDTFHAIDHFDWEVTEFVQNAIYAKVCGHVGETAGGEFMSFIEDPADFISAEEALNGYKEDQEITEKMNEAIHEGSMRLNVLLANIADFAFEDDDPLQYVDTVGEILGELRPQFTEQFISDLSQDGQRDIEYPQFFKRLRRTEGFNKYEDRKNEHSQEMQDALEEAYKRGDSNQDMDSIGV